MRNLKRALCLALACVMLLGMMVIGAGAAYDDFTDKDEIANDEAVKTLVTLGVIAGKDDGSYFDPTGIVTRAEMCKMLCIVLNGGVDPVLGTNDVSSFSDTKGHWAEAYIEFCVSLGIVSGRGDGTFDPNGTVTGTEAAKMMLVVMGWDPDTFGLVGPSWGINTGVEANKAGLYKDLLHINPSEGLTRDNAALLIYNGLLEETMKRTWNQNVTTGEVTETYSLTGDSLFATEFDGRVYEGILLGSGNYEPMGTAGKERIGVNVKVIDGSAYSYPVETAHVTTLKCKEDMSALAGEYVKVLYNLKEKECYGVYSMDSMNTTVLTTLEGNIDWNSATEIEVDDVKYDVDGDAMAYRITGADGTWDHWAFDDATNNVEIFNNDNNSASYVKLVDNDDDGKLDVAIIIDYTVETVNYVGTDNMTLTNMGSVKVKNMDFAGDKPVKDDKVIVTPKNATFSGHYGVAVAEVVEGKVTEVKYASINETNKVSSVRIDGTWYNLHREGDTIIQDDQHHDLDLGGIYKLFVKDGYAYAADLVTAGGTEIGVITGITTNKDFDGYLQARMLLSDGTTVTGYMQWADDDYGNATFKEGSLVAYEMSDGRYDLYPIFSSASAANEVKAKAGYDRVAGSFSDIGQVEGTADGFLRNTGSNRTIAGRRIDNSAVVFVQYDSNTGKADLQSAWRVVSGATVNTWNNDYGVNGAGLYKNSGLGYLEVAIITANDDTGMLPGSSSQYAYVTSAVSAGSDYVSYSIWDGTSESSVAVTEKVSSTNTDASKGAVISFDWDGDGVIKNVTAIDNIGALTYSNGNQVRISGNGYDLADDLTVLNINSDKQSGVNGSSIIEAGKDADGNYYNNVKFQVNSDGEIVLLVIDVINGRWMSSNTVYDEDAGAGILPAGTSANSIKAQMNGAYIPTDLTFANDTTGDAADTRIFKFTATNASLEYTLTIKKGDATVYTEKATFGDGKGHFFYITLNPVEANRGAGTLADVWDTTGRVPAGTYTWAINNGEKNIVSGSFTFAAQ